MVNILKLIIWLDLFWQYTAFNNSSKPNTAVFSKFVIPITPSKESTNCASRNSNITIMWSVSIWNILHNKLRHISFNNDKGNINREYSWNIIGNLQCSVWSRNFNERLRFPLTSRIYGIFVFINKAWQKTKLYIQFYHLILPDDSILLTCMSCITSQPKRQWYVSEIKIWITISVLRLYVKNPDKNEYLKAIWYS